MPMVKGAPIYGTYGGYYEDDGEGGSNWVAEGPGYWDQDSAGENYWVGDKYITGYEPDVFVPDTPVASTPVASTPVASTPAASTPAASTPAASTPAAAPYTPPDLGLDIPPGNIGGDGVPPVGPPGDLGLGIPAAPTYYEEFVPPQQPVVPQLTQAELLQQIVDEGASSDDDGAPGFQDGGLATDFSGYSENNSSEGGGTTNLSFRTPPQGVSFGRFGGDTPLFNVTADVNRATSEVTPQSMGIPPEIVDRFRLQNQQQTSDRYNVGIRADLRALFPNGVPGFIGKVLRPKSVNVSFGQSKSESKNVDGDTFTSSNRSRGIGGQGQVLGNMFGDKAPTIGVQYLQPNRNDESLSGSVDIPVDRGNVSLYGSRKINKGRDNDTTFGVRGKINF